MPINLKYKHQQKTYELMTKELNEYGQAAYSFPTGAGKTFPSLKYLEDNPEQKALIVVPTRVIKRQWEKYIKEGISDGDKRIKAKRIEVITYSKLSLLMKKVKNLNVDVFILDEAQAMGAETYEPAIDQFREQHPNVKEIAMTATPERMDGRNMLYEKYGEHVVYEMSLTDALSGEKEGEVILNAPRYVRVLSQLRPVIDEYKARIENERDKEKRDRLIEKYKRLSTIVSNSPDIEEIMQLGMKKKNGKYIVFCKDREDLQEKMQEAERIFGKVNKSIKKYYILSKGEGELGKTNAQNDGELERFENAEYGEELQLLFCVDMLNLGKHINSENIDGEIMFRETSSKTVYKQQIGRVMVAGDESDEKVIIDAANNWLRQIDIFKEFERAISQGQVNWHGNKLDDFRLQGEELEFLTLLREIGEELNYNYYGTYEQIIEWLENHDGQMPQSGKKKNGVHIKREELDEDEINEFNLYGRWLNCKERKLLSKYIGFKIDEIPEDNEIREKIKKLRSYGLGIKISLYDRLIEWLENHSGMMPHSAATFRNEDGTYIKSSDMIEKQFEEKKLYENWSNSELKKILKKYEEIAIAEIPESEEIKEQIKTLRDYGLGITLFEEYITFLDKYNRTPREGIRKNGRTLGKDETTETEKYEKSLHYRWSKSKFKNILEQYSGKNIEDVPLEYRDKIAKLREYGEGIKDIRPLEERMMDFAKSHEGRIPCVYGKIDKDELTVEAYNERLLRGIWDRSESKKIVNRYVECELDEIPEKYRNLIGNFRDAGIGKNIFDDIIEWLYDGNYGKYPKPYFKKNDGNRMSERETTNKQKKEIYIFWKWKNSQLKKILEEYTGKSIEEVPENYREKIAKLREFGLGLKASKIQKAKQKRDDAKIKNDQTKELEQQVSEQQKKRGKSYDE